MVQAQEVGAAGCCCSCSSGKAAALDAAHCSPRSTACLVAPQLSEPPLPAMPPPRMQAPTGEEEPRQPAVAMHPGMLQGGTGGIPAAAASATGGQDQALASTTTPTSGAAIGGKFSDSYM